MYIEEDSNNKAKSITKIISSSNAISGLKSIYTRRYACIFGK